MSIASQIAQLLGLALSRLFASSATISPDEHYALLDGRRASFVCSELHRDISPENSRNWQWSADLAHHVLITDDKVEVRSGRDPQIRAFRRKTIEAQLEEFLLYLDNPRRSALPDVVAFLVDEFREIWATGGYQDGQSALVAFLFALHAAGEDDSAILDDPDWRRAIAIDTGIDTASVAAAELTGITLERARSMRERTQFGLQLVPSLVQRHTAGRHFQEAHAILESV